MARRKNNSLSRKEEILGILLMTLGVLILASLITYDAQEQPDNITVGSRINNALGIAGVYISDYLVQFTIGYPAFVFPIIVFIFGWNLFRGRDLSKSLRFAGYLFAFALYTSIILAIPEVASAGGSAIGFSLSGLVGGLIAQYLLNFVGIVGSIIILLALIMITVIGATNLSFSNILTNVSDELLAIYDAIRDRWMAYKARRAASATKQSARTGLTRDFVWDEEPDSAGPEDPEARAGESEIRVPPPKPKISLPQYEMDLEEPDEPLSAAVDEGPTEELEVPFSRYVYPTLDLLRMAEGESQEIAEEELNANAQILEDRLMEFNVEGHVVEINPGPVVTRYDVEPAAGVKISRIVSLADDLALAMRAKRIRIVAPVPGKGAVGIEIPNRRHSIVYLREILNSKAFRNSESPLTIALGKTISGEPFVTTLEQMPHLLIAGATGSGKSVCLNSIIASILYKAHPTQVQFAMIDPKRLELTVYNDLRHHHLTYKEDISEEVATSADNAISILKSMVAAMDHRYEILARAGVRNISDYNRRLQEGTLESLEHEEPYKPLPYLVLIIDELADLMLTSAREIEEPIARLAQMARAVGIHLIVATQRPSVNVITGVIKANFPARIAFQVASKTDSRTILDLNGAEKLLGMGDMLFIPQGSPESIRIHGAFLSVEEVEKIISHIRRQPRYPKDKLPIDEADTTIVAGPGEVSIGASRDPLFTHALRLVVRHQQGSISLIQRRLKVGYARAARLVDELEAAGVVGPYDGSKAREVLLDEEELEEMDLG